MIVFVMFMHFSGGSFQYEFKDKDQCENVVSILRERIGFARFNKGFCLEVRK